MKPSRSLQPLANMEEQRKVERLAWECVKARQPGEFWLQENGRKRLAHRDPGTGEVRVYISYDEQPDA